jgi:hypothetical protein
MVGSLDVYLAACGTPPLAVNDNPSSPVIAFDLAPSWAEIGAEVGDRISFNGFEDRIAFTNIRLYNAHGIPDLLAAQGMPINEMEFWRWDEGTSSWASFSSSTGSSITIPAGSLFFANGMGDYDFSLFNNPTISVILPNKVYTLTEPITPSYSSSAVLFPWKKLGPTDGGQTIKNTGSITYFRDDDHSGPTQAIRSEETVKIAMTIVGLDLETHAAITNSVIKLRDIAGSPVPTKRMPLKRGVRLTEYAMMLWGEALSPYGVYPGYYYVPRGVFDGEPERAHTKTDRVGLAIDFVLLEDDNQEHPDDTLGWLDVQTEDS